MIEKLTYKNFFYNTKLANCLWFGMAFLGILLEAINKKVQNNFEIFRGVFRHTIEGVNLYAAYPLQYDDVNHYGPIFSLVIMPFYYFPSKIGAVLWVMFTAFILYKAIRLLPLQEKFQNAILVFASHELLLASEWQQTNQMVAGCIILGFCLIHRGKEAWALFFILLATFIKLYGIVGLVFFIYSKNKWQFVFWGVIWSFVFFCAPMLISSPQFIVQTYIDWYNELVFKANKNIRLDIQNDFQDISVMGMIRRIFKYQAFKNYWVTVPAVLLFAGQYLVNYKYWQNVKFQMYQLVMVLIMTVIFTTSAESPTYIISFTGVCIWYVMQQSSKKKNIIFIAALILTSFSYSDLLTPYVREHLVRPYSLKALPCFVVWCLIIVQSFKLQFLQTDAKRFVV